MIFVESSTKALQKHDQQKIYEDQQKTHKRSTKAYNAFDALKLKPVTASSQNIHWTSSKKDHTSRQSFRQIFPNITLKST